VLYGGYDYDGWYPADYADPGDPPDIVVNRDRWKGRWGEAEIQVISSAIARHILTAGLESRQDFAQDQANWDREVYFDDERDGSHWGVYAQDEFALTDQWTLVTGLRHDYYPTFGGTISPGSQPSAVSWSRPFEALVRKGLSIPQCL